ncbi:intraflagellar transport protein 81 homolog [Hyalella azteca]|uniref:Intraflagellar transport protein 81 homolog n=1 Tax=Hyalella azteca TaxID=294128 RepID=A0A8B7P7M7_HYAAZ|nr:intraflagellar transport protein 81 homolog [Hyalella azteca]
MSDEIKFVVRELNKEPYKKNLNIITFDALEPENLLQVLNDVFAEIDPKHRLDIRHEDPEDMAVRMLGFLRVLQYRPPDHAMQDFRAGLVAGDKHVVQPILAWLLQRPEELKKRAYLAKFLIKVDIPQEFLGDADISEVYGKYEMLVEQFKEVHRTHEALQNSGYSTAELRKDMTAMEEERDLLTQRIAKSKQRVQSNPGYEQALESARNLRLQKEAQKEIAAQRASLIAANEAARQRLRRIEGQIKDLRKSSIGTTADAIIRRLEEDLNVNDYMVNEKLPRDLKSLEEQVATLTRISHMPAMGQDDIDAINAKIEATVAEINSLNDQRLKEVEEVAGDENKMGKLSFFRQNAAMIARRKQQTADRLTELRGELNSAYEELKDKQDELQQFSGQEVLRGDEFKRYINDLRGKSSHYKLKKAELSDLKAEYGVLSRTHEILKAREAQMNEQLSAMEAEHGVSGFRAARDNLESVSSQKGDLDQEKGETLEQMSAMVIELNNKIGDRKSRLAPIIKELRPLRQRQQELAVEHAEKKQSYDSVAVGLDSTVGKLERDVNTLYDDIIKKETQYHLLATQKEVMEYRLQQAENEIKLYLSSDAQDKKKACREQLASLIAEKEKQGKQLRELQKNIKDQVADSGKQLMMWQDVIRLMEVKRRCLEASRNTGGHMMRNSGSEALVLN